jgi:hypothetical protein
VRPRQLQTWPEPAMILQALTQIFPGIQLVPRPMSRRSHLLLCRRQPGRHRLPECYAGDSLRTLFMDGVGGGVAARLWRDCRSTSASAWGPFWPPMPRPRLLLPRPPGGGGVGFP